MARPNMLLIVTDQQALHSISCYGAPICRTPNIDALAHDGVRFTRAYTPCALCTPARGSLLTGVYPHTHGARHNSGCHLPFDEETIGRNLEMYPRRLHDRGYQLGYAGKWHAGLAETCQDVGFEGYGPRGYGRPSDSQLYAEYLRRHSLEKPEEVIEFYASGIDGYAEGDASGYRTGPLQAAPCSFLADMSLRMIRRYVRSEDPFFMALNFWGPHAPYLPSEEFKDMYDPAQIKPWASFHDDLSDRPIVLEKYRRSVFPGAADADWATWSQIVARYYGQVSMIDAAIGHVIAELKAIGVYDEMLIVFTADHGETVGIHGGMFDKGATPWEELYHIPLIVKMPQQEYGAQVRDQFVSLLDLPDTFCQACDVHMGRHTHGTSLLPLMYDPTLPGREDIVAEFHGHRIPVAQRICWWGHHKYVMNFADHDELYDLQADPAEMRNIVHDPAHTEVLKEMRARLYRNMTETSDQLGPQNEMFFTRAIDG